MAKAPIWLLSMDEDQLRTAIEKKRLDRGNLVEMLTRQDLGDPLRQDITYAIEEIDELLSEFERSFPRP